MISIRFIPDGTTQLPTEAQDFEYIEKRLSSVGIPDDVDEEIDGWRDIEQVVPWNGRYIELRVPADELPDPVLGSIVDSMNQVDGIKVHPNGWQHE